VKELSTRAMDLSCNIILYFLFLIGTAAIVICTSTMSPTLKHAGSTSKNLLNSIIERVVITNLYLIYLGIPPLSCLRAKKSTLLSSPWKYLLFLMLASIPFGSVVWLNESAAPFGSS
jgi:hypothetical protein